MLVFIWIWLVVTIGISIVFHISTRKARPAPVPELKPGRLLTKAEAYRSPPASYDYDRTSSPDDFATARDSDPPDP